MQNENFDLKKQRQIWAQELQQTQQEDLKRERKWLWFDVLLLITLFIVNQYLLQGNNLWLNTLCIILCAPLLRFMQHKHDKRDKQNNQINHAIKLVFTCSVLLFILPLPSYLAGTETGFWIHIAANFVATLGWIAALSLFLYFLHNHS